MTVRVCSYRTAKALDGKFPRGYAFGNVSTTGSDEQKMFLSRPGE